MVRDIAQWIGRCSAPANHFPITDPDGGKRFIRDSEAKRRVAVRTTGVMKPPSVGAIKPSPNSLDSCMKVPSFRLQWKTDGRPKGISFCTSTPRPEGSRGYKRKRPTSKDVEDRENASFHTHWRASRNQRVQLATPPVSATDRLEALRCRLLAKKRNCDGNESVA